MKVNDALVGVAIAVLGVVILVHIQGYPTIPGQKYGPAIFPGVIAAGLVICGALLIRGGLRSAMPPVSRGAWMRSPRHVANFLLVLGALLFYIVASDWLGFVLTGALILLALFRQLGVRLRFALPVAIIATLLVHMLFYKLMRVPLPWGVLQPVSW
jgi:putative tricarboxylic transport membrane protein